MLPRAGHSTSLASVSTSVKEHGHLPRTGTSMSSHWANYPTSRWPCDDTPQMTQVTVPEVTHLAGASRQAAGGTPCRGCACACPLDSLSHHAAGPSMEAPDTRHHTLPRPQSQAAAGSTNAADKWKDHAWSEPQKGSPYEQGTVALTGPALQVSTWMVGHPQHVTGRCSLQAADGDGAGGSHS